MEWSDELSGTARIPGAEPILITLSEVALKLSIYLRNYLRGLMQMLR